MYMGTEGISFHLPGKKSSALAKVLLNLFFTNAVAANFANFAILPIFQFAGCHQGNECVK